MRPRPEPPGSTPTAVSAPSHDEAGRIAAVLRHQVLDTPPDVSLDALAALAAKVFSTPMATVSIVDVDRIWFKARHGVEMDQADRALGLCASAILQDETWVIPDAAADPHALGNPLVAGELGLRFYAGHPLRTREGFNLGTICVFDREPRTATDEQVYLLRDLAGLVVRHLEQQSESRRLVTAYETRLHDVQHLANALQRSLLPPGMPVVPYVNIAAAYHPASRYEVGGDFYDLFPIDSSSWGLVIGDVCGKGAVAASQTSGARYSLRAAAIQQPAPAEALAVVNQALLRDQGTTPDSPFVTALFARVCPGPEGTELTLATAGHPGPLVLRASGAVESVGVPGTMLGVFEDVDVTDTRVTLAAGDLVVFFTDGLTDSGSRRLEHEGLVELLRGCTGLSPQDVVDRLVTAVDSAQRDDIAIVAIRCDALD